jgi:SCY1-like protein 1
MTTDLQSTIGTTTTDESGSGSTSATVEAVSPRKPSFPPKPSMTSPTFPSSTKPKGMQLGGTKSQQKIVSAVLAEEWADEAADGNPSPWGTDDLIDINADQDDWSMFY